MGRMMVDAQGSQNNLPECSPRTGAARRYMQPKVTNVAILA